MEPILPEPTTANNYEVAPEEALLPPAPVANAETAPNVMPSQPYETMPVAQASPVIDTSVNITPPAPASASQPQTHHTQAVTNPDPVIADDVDVIEKEWVDKAKRIVSATKNDPHQQEKEVSKLQADYLLKRYNKTVKLTE